MIVRVLGVLVVAGGGALVGGVYGGRTGAEVGALVGACAALALDLLRAGRLLRWLRRSDEADPPRIGGLWGEVAERTRKALRAREQQTARSEARLHEFLAAIQASPNGVTLLDSQGRIEWCNQTAAQHFGLDAQRDLLQPVGNLVRDPGFSAYLAEGDYSREVVIPGRGGSASVPLRVSVRLHPYGEGRKLLLSRDVTALEQAETMRRDFVANVSHEIRTPLTVLAGFIETLQTLPLDEAQRTRYLQLMAQQAQRMQALVTDLLTLSRLEGSPPPAPGQWHAVADLTAQAEAEAGALAQLLGKTLVLEFVPAPLLQVSGSYGELLSLIGNLVGNAVRYTPDAGRIRVQWVALPEGRAEFSVRDTGPGIAPEHLPRLTERFYRVDRSRSRETGGTGLGLAIVKHVVQRHGGELHIDSTPGQGSTFAVRLPASRVSQPGGERLSALPSGANEPPVAAAR